MINPLRRRNRGLTPEQSEEVQKLVFELVHDRLAEAFGPNGMWTVSMKNPDAVDSIFSATVAESLAWDVAARLAPPKKSRHQAPAETKSSRAPQPLVEAAPALVEATPVTESTAADVEEFERLVA